MTQSKFKVLHTDPDNLGAPLDVETNALARIDAELIPVPCTTEDEVIEAAQGMDGILNIRAPIRARAASALPSSCKVIVRYGVGIDTLDPQALTDNSIVIANVPDFCWEEVSNHALLLLLASAKKLIKLDGWTRAGNWGRELLYPMGSIYGQTLGLVACGNIARAVARKAHVFGLEVIGYDPFISQEQADEVGIKLVSFEELLERSDYVSLHTPLTPETRHLMSADQFRQMKNSAFLINTSRGPVVDEPALIQALQNGEIAGAGLDVFEKEPIDPDNPLLKMDNVAILPHTASYSDNAFDLLHRRVGEEMVRVLTGHWPLNLVNPAVREKVTLKDPS